MWQRQFLIASVIVCWMSGSTDALGLNGCCQIIALDEICNNTCMMLHEEISKQNLTAPTPTDVQALSSTCSSTYTSFWTCINETLSSVVQTCCIKSQKEECVASCSQYVREANGNQSADIPEYLTRDCGFPPTDPIWVCISEVFRNKSTVRPPVIPVIPPNADWARLQCCYRATDSICKDSCLDLYSGLLLSPSIWATFQVDCIHRPNEHSLSTCLDDVANPCQLGCSGLQFCRNFNNRPSQGFRQCTIVADRLAKNNYYSWIRSGQIQHPLVRLYVNNIEHCLHELWKAVACISHLQPCHPTSHATQICRIDCLNLLSNCANSSGVPEKICDIIAPSSSDPFCISLDQFIVPSNYGNDVIAPPAVQIMNPCDPNPCPDGFYCSINHLCSPNDRSCICQPGCTIGSLPSIVLPKMNGARVRLISSSERRLFGYINCSSDLTINGMESRQRVPTIIYSERETTCVSLNGVIYDHKSKFWDGCNFCSCYYGRLICTNRSCGGNDSMDCRCNSTYEPVCTNDGITVPNECYANCHGYSVGDYHIGSCASVDACSDRNVLCGDGRCIPQRHSCLPRNVSRCLQYTCESQDHNVCSKRNYPVCDTSHRQHNSLCSFLRSNDNFDYFGYCKDDCSRMTSSSVCGVNGETFSSECHAHDSHILIDYYDRCHSTPSPGENGSNSQSCKNVQCPSLTYLGCRSAIPWGSCCAVCGTVITALIDNVILQSNLISMERNYLTANDIIHRLQYHMNYIACEVFGHLAVDGSFIIIVVPIFDTRTKFDLFVEVCHQEAVKLATLINNRSPLIASDPILSNMIAADVAESIPINNITVTTTETNGCTASFLNNCFYVYTILIMLNIIVM